MPRVWSWYHMVAARWSLWYWKTALPGVHAWPSSAWPRARNSRYLEPTLA
jgi:hypothetical protein